MSYDELDIYCFGGRDRGLVGFAEAFLRKVISAKSLRPAEMVSVAKVLHLWSRLPRTSGTEINVTVSVVSPRRQFGEIETYHWWEVGVDGRQLSIGSGGHFYRPSTGGDTFTTMSWTAEPGESPEFADYRDDLSIVPDLKSFPDAVTTLDLADGEYKFEINDPDNPLLEELAGLDEDSEDEGSPTEQDDDGNSWSLEPRDAAEHKLAALVKPEEVKSKEAQYAYGVDHCDVCGSSLDGIALFVDGALKGQIVWANMCPQCFLRKGTAVGWGSGQLYAKQPNGDWRMVAGFNPAEDSEESDEEFWSE